MLSDLAPFRRDAVWVTVSGHDFLIPWRPAGEWMAHADRLSVLAARLLDPEQREVLADLLLADPAARDELRRESYRILSAATGRRWWEASKLMASAASPETLGRLTLAGVDPWSRSIGEWVAAVYALYVKGADAKQRLRTDFEISIPPQGYEDAWDDDGSGDDPNAVADAMAAMMGG